MWGAAQLLLAASVLALLLKQAPRNATNLTVAAVLLGLVAILVGAITPAIVGVGRAMDFLPRVTPPPEMAAFGKLHAAYSGHSEFSWANLPASFTASLSVPVKPLRYPLQTRKRHKG